MFISWYEKYVIFKNTTHLNNFSLCKCRQNNHPPNFIYFCLVLMKLDCKLHLAHCYTARHAMDAVCFPFSGHKITTLTLAGVALCRLLLWPVFLATRD